MHSTGEKVQWMPVADTSTAVARATCSTSSGSQEAAMPSWVGKIVAPSQKEWPWMQSSPTSSGMPRRVLLRQLAGAEHALRRGVQDRPGVHAQHLVVEVVACVELQHLTDLLLERHPAEQIGDPLVDRDASRRGRAGRSRGHEFS